jgi:hypothetical protein
MWKEQVVAKYKLDSIHTFSCELLRQSCIFEKSRNKTTEMNTTVEPYQQCIVLVPRKLNVNLVQKFHYKNQFYVINYWFFFCLFFLSFCWTAIISLVPLLLKQRDASPSRLAKVAVHGEGFQLPIYPISNLPIPYLNLILYQLTKFCFHKRQVP